MDRALIVREKIKKLQYSLNEDYMGLSDLLYEIWEYKYYQIYGYGSFYAYVETELDIKPRKAAYLVQAKKKLLQLNINWEDVKGIGWRKLACIIPILTRENYKDWIEVALEFSLKDLSDKVKAYKGKQIDIPKTRMAFLLSDEELEIVQTAIDEAKHLWNTSSNSVAIKNICYDWYQNLD